MNTGYCDPRTESPGETEIVHAGGVSLNVRRRGHGPDVLFIGGLGNDMTWWDPLCAHADQITAITVDPPGMGGSPMPARPLYMHELAMAYAELVDVLGLTSPTVVGYSFGGAIALQLAIQAPQLAPRLVLCATGPGLGGIPGDPVALMELATPLRFYSPERLRRISPMLYGGLRARRPERFRTEAFTRTLPPPNPLAYAYQLFALVGWSALPWLTCIQARCLILAGDDDPVFPIENAHLMARRIPRATLALQPGAGHLVVIDEAQEVGSLITRFASSLDAPP